MLQFLKIFYYLKSGQYKADKQLRITVNTRQKEFWMSKELQSQGKKQLHTAETSRQRVSELDCASTYI